MTLIPFETFLECGNRWSSHSIVLDAYRITDTTTRYLLYKENSYNLTYRFYLTSTDKPHTWPYSEINNNNHIIYMPLNTPKIRYILSQIDSVYEFESELLRKGFAKHIWKYFMAKRVARRCRAIYVKRRKAIEVISRFIEKCYFDPNSAYCKQRIFKEYYQLGGK